MKSVLSLRPAQFVLGMKEVQDKVKKLKKLKGAQRKKYIKDRQVPVARINDDFYIIDNHHFVRACWEAGIKKVQIKVIGNYTGLKHMSTFWGCMRECHWTYLVNQAGCVTDPKYLPVDIRGMADDPYRSLAWAVREAGGFTKMPVPFFEFKWATFLRERIPIEEVKDDFKGSVKKAVKLCKSKAAKGLPGYKK